MMKKILQISFWLIILAGIIVIFGFAVSEQKKTVCSGLVINLKDAEQPGFIYEKDVRAIISQLYPSLRGKILDSLNTAAITKELNRSPYLKNPIVVKTLNGLIKVQLERTEALVRVVNSKGDSFYLSKEGYVMPISRNYIPKTLIVTGHIYDSPNPYDKLIYNVNGGTASKKSILNKIFFLAVTIINHSVFNQSIDQIYVTDCNEFEMVPSSGDHIILLGDVENLNHKLENLNAFYQAGISKLEEGEYKIFDLRFKDQVVCKKLMP